VLASALQGFPDSTLKLSVPNWLALTIAIALPLQGAGALTQRLRQLRRSLQG